MKQITAKDAAITGLKVQLGIKEDENLTREMTIKELQMQLEAEKRAKLKQLRIQEPTDATQKRIPVGLLA